MTSKNNKDFRFDFLGEHAKVKSEVSEEEIKSLLLRLSQTSMQENESATMQQLCTVRIKKKLSASSSDMEIAENIFYYMRHYLNFKYIFYFGQLTSMANIISDFQFTIAISNTLSRYKVAHEIGVSVDRRYADNDNLIISAQLIPFIRLYDNDSTIISYPNSNMVFGEYHNILEGCKAHLMDKESAIDGNPIYSSDIIESSTYNDNHVIDSIFINLDNLGLSKISFIENYSLLGSQKIIYYNLVNPFISTYSNEADEYANYNTYRKADLKKIEENKKGIEKSKYEYYAKRHNEFMTLLTNSQNVEDIEFDTINVSCMGRWSQRDTLKYQLKYSYQGGINSAGNFFIVDIGKFIGRNKEFSEEEINREVAIYNNTPLKYDWVISMNIPEGFIIESLDNLQMSLDNQAGSFSSSANFKDNKLIVNVQKIYKKNYNNLEEWPEVLEFMQAAINFTQQQILLSPVD